MLPSNLIPRGLRGLLPLALCLSTTPLAAYQDTPSPSLEAGFVHDTGWVENRGSQPAVVISFTVQLDDARWLRMMFDDVSLSGNPAQGTGSILRITSHEDGEVQELNALHVRQWRNRSAYFNGDAVQVDVVAWPGTGDNRVAMSKVVMGLGFTSFETICGSDDRVLSTDPRAARTLPSGCSGWMIDDCKRCFLTAGHCSNIQTTQFNVPLSDPDGTINHPSPDDQYAVDAASMQSAPSISLGSDWRYFGCFANPNTGLTPADAQGAVYDFELPPNFQPGQMIRITGYGVDDSPPTSNKVQQTNAGPRVSAGGTVLGYVTDTTGASSGSPVIFENDGTAIGIHTNGGCSGGGGNNWGTANSNAGLQNAIANPEGICAGGIQVLTNLPDSIPAGTTTKIDLSIAPGFVPGSEKLLVSYDDGVFIELPLTPTGGDFYKANLPPPVCGANPRFYFSIEDASCGLLTVPEGGAGAPFTAVVGTSSTLVDHDMETATGWTGGAAGDTASTGMWTRVNPNGTEAQAENDHSPAGTQCWVTGQGASGGGQGDNDVDGGFTTLTSPVFDLTGLNAPVIDYWRWYANDTGSAPNADVFTIEATDDGSSWQTVEIVGPTGPGTSGGWIQHQFNAADIVTPGALFQMRFIAADLGSGSIVEAGIDDFRLRDFVCAEMLDDCNANGIEDVDDIQSGRSMDANLDGIPDECDLDCNDNGIPDGQELDATLYCMCGAGAPCSNPDATGGCANSTLAGALLSACGSDSVSADDLELFIVRLPANQNGLVFMGPTQIALPFGDGLRCVGAGGTGVFRFGVQNAGAGGTISLGPGIVAHSQANFPAQGQIEAGETWNFQLWYRDPAGPCGSGFNLSNGLSVSFGG